MKLIKEIISQANIIHNNFYDYSKVIYKNFMEKVCIICPIHGNFYQDFHSHLQKHGCPDCGLKSRALKRVLSTDDFIKKAHKVHGIGSYDYSKVDYIGWDKEICIICQKHGEIWQRASFHLRGHGCYKCSRESKRFSLNDFILKANHVHGAGTYDYSLVKLNSLQDKISIICRAHGIFLQRANKHLAHQGCTLCKLNKGENAIRKWLLDNNIEFKPQYTYPDLRGQKNGNLKFDFYTPSLNLLIEFDGEQHFTPARFLPVEEAVKIFQKTYHYDNLKNDYCSKRQIPLLRIPYKDYKNIPKIMECFFGERSITDLLNLISFGEYGFNVEYAVSDALAKNKIRLLRNCCNEAISGKNT